MLSLVPHKLPMWFVKVSFDLDLNNFVFSKVMAAMTSHLFRCNLSHPSYLLVRVGLFTPYKQLLLLTYISNRFPLRLDKNFQHSTERQVLITDQPYIFIFFQTVTKILQ